MTTKIKRRPPRTWAEAPEVMDSEYIAILLGLTVQHVRTLTRSGELPAVKVGKNYRYDKGQIMKRLGALEEVNQA